MDIVMLNSYQFKNLQFDKITKDTYINNIGITTKGTPSELEVFNLRSKGYSIIEISLKLNCSDRTVQRRINRIKWKILGYECKLLLTNN